MTCFEISLHTWFKKIRNRIVLCEAENQETLLALDNSAVYPALSHAREATVCRFLRH